MIEFHLDGRSRIAPLYGDFTGAELLLLDEPVASLDPWPGATRTGSPEWPR